MNLLMAASGLTLGFFIAFAREPLAGAIAGGILSVASAVGVYLLNPQAHGTGPRFHMLVSGTLYLYAALLFSFLAFSGISYRYLPSSLEYKRQLLAQFLETSGITSLEVSNRKYDLLKDAKLAAAALLLTQPKLGDAVGPIRLFSTGTAADQEAATVQPDVCDKLKVTLSHPPVDRISVLETLRYDTTPAVVVAYGLLQGIEDGGKFADSVRFVLAKLCPESKLQFR